MAVLKEFVCAGHGEFEGFEPVCPRGCKGRFVRQEIRTPPSIRHVGTRNTDALTQQLANDFGLSNVSSKDGESVMTNLRKIDWRKHQGQAPSVWAGGVPHAEPGWSQREEKAKTFSPSEIGMQGGAPLRQTNGKVTVDIERGGRTVAAPIPKVRAAIVKDDKGRPLSYKAALPEVD